MPDRLFEAGEHRFLVASVDVDDTVWSKTDLSQSRREQVLPGNAPKDLAFGPRRDAGCEQSCSGPVDGGVAAACDFVQRAERQASTRQSCIDGLDAKREDRAGAQRRLKPLNLLTETANSRRSVDVIHNIPS